MEGSGYGYLPAQGPEKSDPPMMRTVSHPSSMEAVVSTTEVLKRGGADLQSTDERARAAVKAFHRMQPSLSAYARALTGKSNVQVVVSSNSNGHTDGKKIFFRPPLALGDNTPHDRALCDRRDPETLQQMCPACDIREQVLIVIYHEIAHIAQGSFEEIEESERAEMIKYSLSLVDKKYADAVMSRVEMASPAVKSTYIGMAGLVSPYLPGIVNALEDARVNRDAAIARKGTRIMFQVDTMRVLSTGFENKMPDGSVRKVYWNEQPLNAQMVCALYARSAGYKMEDFFVPEVVAALDDKRIKEILRDFSTVRNAQGVYILSVALLVRMRELGFYKHHTDPKVEDEPDQSQDDEQQEENKDGDKSEDGSDSSDDSTDAEQGTGEDDGQEDPNGDPSESGAGSTASSEDGSEEGQEDSSGDRTSDADGNCEGESGLDSESDATDAGVGEEEAEAGSDDEAEASGNGSKGSADEGASSDERGGEQSEADGGSVPEPSEQSDAESGSEQGGEVDETQSDTDGSDKAVADSTSGEGGDAGRDESDQSDGSQGERHDPDSPTGEPSDDASEEGSSDSDRGLGEPQDSDRDACSGYGGPEGQLDEQADKSEDSAGSDDADDSGDFDDLAKGDLPERDDSTQEHEEGLEEDEVIDSGADEGLGGVEVIEDSAFDRLPMGTPEEVNGAIHEIAHPEERPDHIKEEARAEKTMDRAIVQGLYFETPSRNVFGVREHYYDRPCLVDGQNMSQAWDQTGYSNWGYSRKQLGIEGEFECSERILGPALLRMRVAFADNQRGKDLRNRKSGKVDGRMLGRRAFHNDERLFKRRIIPGKKDYFVLIGIDVSGSTIGENIMLAKRAAMAQAELCARMGIKFAVYAHSGNYHNPDSGRIDGLDMDIYHVKDADEPWTENIKKRLADLGPASVNLDGHTFEYYRKILDGRTETHRVILYYTDGKMPAENHDEELIILQREIKICRQKKYVLMGVGIRTDSPVRHGLDTIQVNTDDDIIKVVQRLEKRLLAIA